MVATAGQRLLTCAALAGLLVRVHSFALCWTRHPAPRPKSGYDRRPTGPANFAEYLRVMADNGRAMFTQVGWVCVPLRHRADRRLPGPDRAPYLSAHTSVNQARRDNLGQGGTLSALARPSPQAPTHGRHLPRRDLVRGRGDRQWRLDNAPDREAHRYHAMVDQFRELGPGNPCVLYHTGVRRERVRRELSPSSALSAAAFAGAPDALGRRTQ